MNEIFEDRKKLYLKFEDLDPPEDLEEYYNTVLEFAKLKAMSSEAIYDSCLAGASYDIANFAEEAVNYTTQSSQKLEAAQRLREGLEEKYS